MRLIDADVLKQKLGLGWVNAEFAFYMINETPTADAEIVKHGRWICFPESMKFDSVYCADQIACSECKQAWDICDNDTDTFNYCPYCGAKMDGGEENENS